MSTEQSTIPHDAPPSPIPFPGVSINPHGAVPAHHSASEPAAAPQLDDPRWVFAMRVRSVIERGQGIDYEQMHGWGHQVGLSPIFCDAIIGAVERATKRGAPDGLMVEEIMQVPVPAQDGIGSLTTRSRWIVFSALFAWAFVVAGVMQVVV